jgi:hypothetical protein
MTRKVILKRRPRLEVLRKQLEAVDREREILARIEPKETTICGLPSSLIERAAEKANPAQKEKLNLALAAASDFEFWRAYRHRFEIEEEKNCRDIAPRGDAIEKMLAQQMAACHRKAMDFVGREGLGEADAMNQAIRLMRVFSGQVEALKIWRSKGQQTMVVKHITHNLNVGGKAVMGGEITASPRG